MSRKTIFGLIEESLLDQLISTNFPQISVPLGIEVTEATRTDLARSLQQ